MAAAAAAFNLEEQDKIEGSEIADLFERCESLIAPQHRIVTTHLDAGGAQPFLERTVESASNRLTMMGNRATSVPSRSIASLSSGASFCSGSG